MIHDQVAHLENDGKQLRDILTQKENEVATARQTVLNFEREAQALREQVRRKGSARNSFTTVCLDRKKHYKKECSKYQRVFQQ